MLACLEVHTSVFALLLAAEPFSTVFIILHISLFALDTNLLVVAAFGNILRLDISLFGSADALPLMKALAFGCFVSSNCTVDTCTGISCH